MDWFIYANGLRHERVKKGPRQRCCPVNFAKSSGTPNRLTRTAASVYYQTNTKMKESLTVSDLLLIHVIQLYRILI